MESEAAWKSIENKRIENKRKKTAKESEAIWFHFLFLCRKGLVKTLF